MGDMITIFDRERVRLSKAVNKAALALLAHMQGSAGFRLQIPHTTPPLYVIAGNAETVKKLADCIDGRGKDCLD